jgi:hypothetical protein
MPCWASCFIINESMQHRKEWPHKNDPAFGSKLI